MWTLIGLGTAASVVVILSYLVNRLRRDLKTCRRCGKQYDHSKGGGTLYWPAKNDKWYYCLPCTEETDQAPFMEEVLRGVNECPNPDTSP